MYEDRTLTVLIVEDDRFICEALRRIMKNNFSCHVDVVHDGHEAWERVRDRRYDLVISDWNMPQKTGDQLLLDIRRQEVTRDLPFLMLTARSDKESVITAQKAGASDYICKPFRQADVVNKVSKILEIPTP